MCYPSSAVEASEIVYQRSLSIYTSAMGISSRGRAIMSLCYFIERSTENFRSIRVTFPCLSRTDTVNVPDCKSAMG